MRPSDLPPRPLCRPCRLARRLIVVIHCEVEESPMLTVHHLNESRSQRILWLLEELQVPYEIRPYLRDPKTSLAPADLKEIHPLGKSPVISDGDRVIAESGAIIDYIIRRHGGGKLQPDRSSDAYDEYVHWLH